MIETLTSINNIINCDSNNVDRFNYARINNDDWPASKPNAERPKLT